MKPDSFLASHSLFTREELAEALHGRRPATIDAHLARWRRQGRILRVKNGVYVRSEAGGASQPSSLPDFVALASRMAPDAVTAYHTALEAHGFAQSLFERFTFVTRTRVKPVDFLGRRFVPVRPRAPLADHGGGAPWVELVDRAGLEARVTSVERTVVDVLDRPSISGGAEEVWRSLASVPAVDPEPLLGYVRALGSHTVAARVGYFLDVRGDELAVPGVTLDELESMRPRQAVYLDRSLGGRLISRWNLIVPDELVGRAAGGAW
jgi:predicted transcriptional regulator of viral defense system